ncbi:MAG: ATP-binding cassette domain-containing protein [Flavobacteriales bacterium]
MSERILKALMQLFAIIAKVEENEDTGEVLQDEGGRKIVALFLKQELNQELVEEYLKVFDEFLENHQGKSRKKDGKQKRTSVNSVKVLRICSQINEELTQKQKMIVFMRILEFIQANGEVDEQEIEFVDTVAESFNISKQENDQCKLFIETASAEQIDNPAFLNINSTKESSFTQSRHIYSEGITGHIRILKIDSVGILFFRYHGSDELYLNGQAITNDRNYIFNQGSSLRSSKVQPIYYSDVISRYLSDKSSKKIVFEAKEIQYHFKGGNIGLRPLNFREDSGKLIGIMGGSGAGKSTLLNILNGNYPPTHGKVTINGIDIHYDKIVGVIGYVSQDDLLIEELTVFQNLFYNAKLCFGNYTDVQITKLVIKTLEDIGLSEARDLKVGSPLEKTISGGQRKRLNIALELIREPSVMFVDEPTSGLSSRDSENIMDLLKELALKGKLIFVVIHQPSSDIFKMFDKLLILDQGGYPIYNGNPVDAIVYFKKQVNHVKADESECSLCGNVNPEQIFNIIESKVVDEYGNLTGSRKVSPKEWNKLYQEKIMAGYQPSSDTDKQEELPDSIFKIPNKLKQFKVFMTRDVLSKLTNTQYMIITLFEAPALAAILAFFMKYFDAGSDGSTTYIFRESENLPQYLFIAVIVALFVGLTTSAEEIIGNQKILKREKFLNLSKGSYLISKILIMFFISAVQTLFFTLVGNYILEIKGMTMYYWVILFSTSCFANMLGLNISASFNSAKVIYILIPILIIPQLLFSGIIVSFDKLNPLFASQSHVPWIGNVMASRWAYEGLAVTQFKENAYEKNFYAFDKKMKFANWKKDFWLSNLDSKVKSLERIINEEEKPAEFEQWINILRIEIEKEMRLIENVKCEGFENLTPEKLDRRTLKQIDNYFAKLKEIYKGIYKKNQNDKDAIIRKMQSTEEGRLAFKDLQDNYRNEALLDFVTNSNSLTFIVETPRGLVQKSDPIYLDPYDSELLSSHFYAPRKKLFGTYYNTFTANVMVLWFMCIILIVTLYMDLLKKTIDLFGKLKIPGFSKKKE